MPKLDEETRQYVITIHHALEAEDAAEKAYFTAVGNPDYDRDAVARLDAARATAGDTVRDALYVHFLASEKAAGRPVDSVKALALLTRDEKAA